MKNTYLLVILLLTSSNILSGQILFEGDQNYYQFIEEMDSDIDNSSKKKISRNHHFYETRLFPSGILSDYQAEYQRFLMTDSRPINNLNVPAWSYLGEGQIHRPLDSPSYDNGRVTFIKFHPFEPNTIFVGSPTGSVWVSYDDGAYWEILSDDLPPRGYTDMAFDTISNTIYLLSGDFDGKSSPFYGLFKSNDNGQSWIQLNSPNISFGKKIMAHPTISELVYLNSQDSLYISNDAGLNWTTSPELTNVYDVEFDVINPNKMYAYSIEDYSINSLRLLYQSFDNGRSFEVLHDFTPYEVGGAEIAIHPETNNIYICTFPPYSFNLNIVLKSTGIFKSTDSGINFQLVEGSKLLNVTRAAYNTAFDVFPTENERLLAAWVEMFVQSEEDTIWHRINENQYVHVDYHCVTFDPKNMNCVLIGNDGGVYRSCDLGLTWENITGNMRLTQVYTFDNSNTCEDLMLMGTQDNGSAVLHQEKWLRVATGDGFSCAFSAFSNDTIYYSFQYQGSYRIDSFYQFIDGDNYYPNRENIIPRFIDGLGSFQTVFRVSNLKSGLIYHKDVHSIYKSENYGHDYSIINEIDGRIFSIKTSPTNPAFVVSTYKTFDPFGASPDSAFVQYSFDEGENWSTSYMANPTLDSIGSFIPSAITFDPINEGRMWVAINRFDSHKIFHTSDFGATWEEYSEGLPNIHINDLLYQPYSNDAIYLATDAGIYFRNDSLNSWIDYSSNLPKTIFTELKISNVAEKLRASSYGMGIWEVDLFRTYNHPPVSNFDCRQFEICQGEDFQWNHQSTFSPDSVIWFFEGGVPNTSTENNPSIHYEDEGVFSTTLITINDTGRDTLVRKELIAVLNTSFQIDSQLVNNDSYILSVNVPYQSIEWNTGESTQTIEVIESGWYFATIINENTCTATDSIYIEFTTSSVAELTTNSCQIFPNPSSGNIQITCDNGNFQNGMYTIYNLFGQVVQSGKLTNDMKLNLGKGIYTVQLTDLSNSTNFYSNITIVD